MNSSQEPNQIKKADQTQEPEENVGPVPLSERYALSINEAADYFHIGRSKLRNIAAANPYANYVLRSVGKTLIKRKQFEKFLDLNNDI